jgi:Divergent InlB B-repeat domain
MNNIKLLLITLILGIPTGIAHAQNPVVSIQELPADVSIYPDQEITTTASYYYDEEDPPGTPTTTTWTVVENPIAGTVNFVTGEDELYLIASFTSPGTYRLRLTVDDTINSNSADLVVTVLEPVPNLPPLVNAGPDAPLDFIGENNETYVTLQGSDSDQDFLPWPHNLYDEWSFIDGPKNENGDIAATIGNIWELDTQVYFYKPGIYTLQLLATDGEATVTDTVDINVIDLNPPTYGLTVFSGSGSGTYLAGISVNITADAAPAGQMFDKWTGAAVVDDTNSSTTLIMPAANTTVTATYKNSPLPPVVNQSELEIGKVINLLDRSKNSAVIIPYTMGAGSHHLKMEVYTLQGTRVRTLIDSEVQTAGSVSWDGKNADGYEVASDAYVLIYTIDGKKQTPLKLIVL